jgi:hypothetical protein
MLCGRCCVTEPPTKLALRLDIFIEILPRTRVNNGKKKQLSWMSRGKVLRRPPRGAVFEDSVEDRQELAHAGHQCHLLRFAGR